MLLVYSLRVPGAGVEWTLLVLFPSPNLLLLHCPYLRVTSCTLPVTACVSGRGSPVVDGSITAIHFAEPKGSKQGVFSEYHITLSEVRDLRAVED